MTYKFIEIRDEGNCFDKVFLVNLSQLICIEFVISKIRKKDMTHEIVYTTKDKEPIIEYFDNETKLDKFEARCHEIRQLTNIKNIKQSSNKKTVTLGYDVKFFADGLPISVEVNKIYPHLIFHYFDDFDVGYHCELYNAKIQAIVASSTQEKEVKYIIEYENAEGDLP